MSKARSGDTVRIHYTGTLDDGSQFDSSVGREPLEFSLGSGQVIAGFDKAVESMEVGGRTTVTLTPDKAYGDHHKKLVQQVPRSTLPEDLKLVCGMQLQTQDPDGQIMNLLVTEIAEDSITVDANHPLAGMTLTFAIELLAIVRSKTA